MDRETRLDAIFVLYASGERSVARLTKLINQKFHTTTHRTTIEADLETVKARDEAWAHDLAFGGQMARVHRFETIILKAINRIDDKIEQIDEVGSKGAYHLAQLAAALENLIKLQMAIVEKIPMYQLNEETQEHLQELIAKTKAIEAKAHLERGYDKKTADKAR